MSLTKHSQCNEDIENNGASCFMSRSNYERFVEDQNNGKLGYADGDGKGNYTQHMIPRSEADALEDRVGCDAYALETELGLNHGSLDTDYVKIDTNNGLSPDQFHDVEPDVKGNNDEHKLDGTTTGGQHELTAKNLSSDDYSVGNRVDNSRAIVRGEGESWNNAIENNDNFQIEEPKEYTQDMDQHYKDNNYDPADYYNGYGF